MPGDCPLPLEFHPQAIAEARAAYEWYASKSPKAAQLFLDELDHAVEQIEQHPELWPTYLRGSRRYVMRVYPFSVVYTHITGRLAVIAVAHAGRRPGYWKRR